MGGGAVVSMYLVFTTTRLAPAPSRRRRMVVRLIAMLSAGVAEVLGALPLGRAAVAAGPPMVSLKLGLISR